MLSPFFQYQGIPLWRNVRVLRTAVQVVSAILVVAIVAFAITNVLEAAEDRGLSLGFEFLELEAGFPISESLIGYEESDSYLHAFTVGILNMLKVSIIGVFLATLLGAFVGVCRLSSNWLVSRTADVYVESVRNVPLLVQLFFWYFAVFQTLPRVQQSIQWPGPVFINNRGIFFAWARPTEHFDQWLLFVAAGVVGAVLLWLGSRRLTASWGQVPLIGYMPVLVLVLVPLAGWFLLGGPPLAREAPVLGRFNFEGGLRLTPEFGALLVGLVIYTASFIAEIVRAGIQSVPRGQVEAGQALGLSGFQRLRLVVLPQALRVIIPPLISQYLNLTKNSSLAIAIGYPDLFGVGRIMINQAGRAIPIFLLIMSVYLAVSLAYAIVGNLYNRFGLRYLRRGR